MSIDEIMEYLKDNYPDIDKNREVSKKMIEDKEKELGIQFPVSYKKFLLNFSNGILLLDVEPIAGVDENSLIGPGAIGFPDKIIPLEPVVYLPNKYAISKNRLLSLTLGSAMEISPDHWVFICNKEYENNEYPVGLLCESTRSIIHVVKNFEEWLTILIEGDKNGLDTSVINILYPDWDEKCDIMDGDKESYKPMYHVID